MKERCPSVRGEAQVSALLAAAASPDSARKEPACTRNLNTSYGDLPLFSVIPVFQYYSSSQPCSAVDTRLTQRFWHLAPCLLLGTAFSNDNIVGTRLWPFSLWCVMQGRSSRDNTGRTSSFGNVQRFQIRLGILHKSFYHGIWQGFFHGGCFHKKCPQNPASAHDSWAVGILPFLQ